MKELFKNIFRYTFKNKFGYFAIGIFVLLSIMIFAAFINLGTTINYIFNNITTNYNLHNIVINEKYSDNSIEANNNRNKFQENLNSLDITYRDFNSINVTNSTNNNLIKIIEYLPTYTIDRLKIFNEIGLPKNEFNESTLPSGINFDEILSLASSDLLNSTVEDKKSCVNARQKIIYICTKSNYTNESFLNEFNDVWNEIISSNYTYDPILGSTSISSQNVAKYLSSFLIPTNPNYSPIIVRGQRITINLTYFNGGIPAISFFDDPYASIAVVSNKFLEENNKKIYSFEQFQKDILSTDNNSNIPSNWINGNIENFLSLKSNNQINNFINSLDNQYKIDINNIPYVIVGSGITPDFIYPIISLSNTIPNPKNEGLVYVNKNGYLMAENSFANFPHESFLVAKYNGNLSKNEILKNVNDLSNQYMNWPSNVKSAYWYNDLDNKMTPSSLRIVFITSLVTSFILVSVLIGLFIIILVTLTMVLYSKNFITKNKLPLAIMISNGMNKNKILFSISFVASFICILTCPLGLLAAYYLEFFIFNILSNYWFIPTPITMFNAGWFIWISIIPTVLFILINYIVGWYTMKKNLVDLLKENHGIKVNKFYILFSPLIRWTNVIYKYKTSIAFSSVIKIIFITILTTLSIIVINTGINVSNNLSSAYSLERNTNNSTFNIDLVTPTSQSGQYVGLPLSYVGTNLKKQNIQNLNEPLFSNINYANDEFLSSAYKSSPIFRNYSTIAWPTMNDSTYRFNDILYMKNKIQMQEILNYFFGIGNIGINAWDFYKSLAPTNQVNESNNLSVKLKENILTDMRPMNQAFFNNIDNLKLIQPNDNNSILFPTYWVIQNFNESNYSDWNTSLNDEIYFDGIKLTDENVGVLNASELVQSIDENNTINYLFDSVDDVIKNQNNFAELINNAYSTYGVINQGSDEIPNELNNRLIYKYYPNLFTQNALSNFSIVADKVIFKVDVQKNATQRLITNRSMLLNYMKRIEIVDFNNLSTNIILDPFDTNSYIDHKYGYEIDSKKVLLPLPFTLNTNFINFILNIYNDPYYYLYFYRILNNYVIFNETNNEQYIHIDGLLNNNNNNSLKVVGLIENSRFIRLFDNNNKLINYKLFDSEPFYDENNTLIYPVIVNNYVQNQFNLNINSEFELIVSNHVDRYKYKNQTNDILNQNYNLSQLEFYDQPIVKFKVIGINNTGNGPQIYTTFENGQKILGLASQKDFINNIDISNIEDNNNFKIGLNNQYNKFGGFNGIFTNEINPYFLNITLSLYSPSGLYPGFDAWENSYEIINLISSALNNTISTRYLANALDIDYQTLINKINTTNNTQLINKIIDIISNKYGKSTLLITYETINSLSLQEPMFDELSNTFNRIIILCASLLFVMCILIIIIISSLVINQISIISSILSTLGYSNKTNTSTFFSIFSPCLIISIALSVPLLFIINNFFKKFLLNNIDLLLQINFSWQIFLIVTAGLIGVYGCIYLIVWYKFKKTNILDSLKW